MLKIEYTPFQKKLRNIKKYFLFICCIFMMLFGIDIICDEINFRNNAVATTAVIVSYTNHGIPILSFDANEQKYVVSAHMEIPNSNLGSEVEIKYHKNNPTYIQIGGNPFLETGIYMAITGTIGTIVLWLIIFRKWKFFKWI